MLYLIMALELLLSAARDIVFFNSTFVLQIFLAFTLLSWLHKSVAHKEPKLNAGRLEITMMQFDSSPIQVNRGIN